MLEAAGRKCNHKRVDRLMRKQGIRAKRVKMFKVSTNSNQSEPIADNHLNRGFTICEPIQVWVSDLIDVETVEGRLYLAVFHFLYSRMVDSWLMSERMIAKLVVSTFGIEQGR